MKFEHLQLDNGLNIIAEANPSAASMAAGFFVRTGSRDEAPGISGVSHFLEHMVFKGTDRRSAMDVNREFDELGASYNAFTSEENTVYYAAVLPEFQERIVDLLCDIMRPALRKDDFDTEKTVILDEIALYEDQPRFRVYDKLMGEHFRDHPLGNAILGSTESVSALRQEDMKAYFDRRYSPGNITVAGVGNLDFDAFAAQVSQMCSSWKPFDVERQHPKARPASETVVIADRKVTREHIGMMSRAPSCQDDARYAAQILAAIIGDATGSRLYYALIDHAIADEASMTYSPLDKEGAFLTFISADADRAAEAAKIAMSVFRKFAESGPTETELQAAKNKIATGATAKGEQPMGRLTAVGFDWVYMKQYIPLPDDIARLLRVGQEEVVELARRFELSEATVLGLGPLESL